MTWILTWIVVSHFITACPHPGPICDKFGICTQSDGVTALACWDTREKQMCQAFPTEQAARAFMVEMEPNLCANKVIYGAMQCIKDVKLEEK